MTLNHVFQNVNIFFSSIRVIDRSRVCSGVSFTSIFLNSHTIPGLQIAFGVNIRS